MNNTEPIPNLNNYLLEWSADLSIILQNDFVSTKKLVELVGEYCGLRNVIGRDDVSLYIERGWLVSDCVDDKSGSLHHPFRVYPLYQAVDDLRFKLPASLALESHRWPDVFAKLERSSEILSGIDSETQRRSNVVTLAILLEPVYWPYVTSEQLTTVELSNQAFDKKLRDYNEKIISLVRQLDLAAWEYAHRQIILDADRLDSNHELYMLLRASNWDQRKKLKGRLSGGLWFRHIAEVLRIGFEEAYEVKWAEEDDFRSKSMHKGRTVLYGSVRPLDDIEKSRPYIARNFGLITGSIIRWYVEGETEYYAIRRIMSDPSREYVELVNLKGNVATGKGNIAMKLTEMLNDDKSVRRFSAISIDTDIPENLRLIRRQIREGRIVGFIAAHDPDFEFANFVLTELIEIAARFAEREGIVAEQIRMANWANVSNAKQFEVTLVSACDGKINGLKGKDWGEALADYAKENATDPRTGEDRALLREIRAASWAGYDSYDLQAEKMTFDDETFKLIPRSTKLNANG